MNDQVEPERSMPVQRTSGNADGPAAGGLGGAAAAEWPGEPEGFGNEKEFDDDDGENDDDNNGRRSKLKAFDPRGYPSPHLNGPASVLLRDAMIGCPCIVCSVSGRGSTAREP